MELRALGSTGITVSALGLGTVKFGRNQGVKYPRGFALPSDQQIRDLQQTIDNVPADLVVVATPIDLSRLVTFAGPYERVRYSLEEKSSPGLASIIKERFPFLQ